MNVRYIITTTNPQTTNPNELQPAEVLENVEGFTCEPDAIRRVKEIAPSIVGPIYTVKIEVVDERYGSFAAQPTLAPAPSSKTRTKKTRRK